MTKKSWLGAQIMNSHQLLFMYTVFAFETTSETFHDQFNAKHLKMAKLLFRINDDKNV